MNLADIGVLALMITNTVKVAMVPIPAQYTAIMSWPTVQHVDGYRVYYSTNEGAFTNYIQTPRPSVAIPNLWTGVRYYFASTCIIYCGGSTWSEGSLSTQVDNEVSVNVWHLTCPSNYTIQSCLTLSREVWLDYPSFTISNDSPQKFFRAVNHNLLKTETQ